MLSGFWFILFLVLLFPAEGYYWKRNNCDILGTKKFTRLVTFGDSCTDDAGDGSGFTRYSNGNIWAEYVAERLDVDLDNRAFGGANSDYTNTNTGPLEQTGFLYQVDTYVPTDVSRSLHTVWVGYNDFWDGNGDPVKAARNVVLGLTKLVAKGAQYIIVFTEIKFDAAPGYSTAFNSPKFCHGYDYSAVKEIVAMKLVEFNTALKLLIVSNSSLYGANVFVFDTWKLHQDTLLNHVFSNITAPWSDFKFQYPYSSEQFMWWDGWHVTTSMHKIISDSLFEAVPFLNARTFPSFNLNFSPKKVPVVNKIVAFGHSLSGDAGSGLNFTRSTNGPVWVEYISSKMDVPVLSFSWIGSKTDSKNIYSSVPLGFSAQIDRYRPIDIANTLHTISVGLFDFYDGQGDISVSVGNIFSGIKSLVNRGAKNFLLLNEIQWDKSPIYSSHPVYQVSYNKTFSCNAYEYTSVRGNVSSLIKQFNNLLFSKYVIFKNQNPSINIMFFDAWAIHERTFSQTIFSDIQTPWFDVRYAHPYDVSNFMWWNGWNPTTTLHKIFADAVLAQFYSTLFNV